MGEIHDHRLFRISHLGLSDSVRNLAPRVDSRLSIEVQIYDGGNMPTTGDRYFLAHPVYYGGDQCEGCDSAPLVDNSVTITLVVLYDAPEVGDILTAYLIGGRWVAQLGGGKKTTPPCDCLTTVCLENCNGPQQAGIFVSFRKAGLEVAFCITDNLGCCQTCIPKGTYDVYQGPLPGGTFLGTIDVECDDVHKFASGESGPCGGSILFPGTNLFLTLTDAQGTWPCPYGCVCYYMMHSNVLGCFDLADAPPSDHPIMIGYQVYCPGGDDLGKVVVFRQWAEWQALDTVPWNYVNASGLILIGGVLFENPPPLLVPFPCSPNPITQLVVDCFSSGGCRNPFGTGHIPGSSGKVPIPVNQDDPCHGSVTVPMSPSPGDPPLFMNHLDDPVGGDVFLSW